VTWLVGEFCDLDYAFYALNFMGIFRDSVYLIWMMFGEAWIKID
jgi:hypothetical protein